jgi:hypothetical protein
MADDSPSRGDKLLILTALLFAVRLFRSASTEIDHSPSSGMPRDTSRKLEEIEASERELAASRSSRDADAILKAVEKLP